MGNLSITVDNAKVYKLRPKDRQGTWADITIREWEKGGSIDIQSDFGNYAYSWNSIGDGTFCDFLCKLDYDYFMGKTTGNRGQVFSIERSLEELYDLTMKMRQENDITCEEALTCLCVIDGMEVWVDSESDYRSALEHNPNIGNLLYGGEWHYIDFVKVPDPPCVAFWEIIWPVICAYWKAEKWSDAFLEKHT